MRKYVQVVIVNDLKQLTRLLNRDSNMRCTTVPSVSLLARVHFEPYLEVLSFHIILQSAPPPKCNCYKRYASRFYTTFIITDSTQGRTSNDWFSDRSMPNSCRLDRNEVDSPTCKGEKECSLNICTEIYWVIDTLINYHEWRRYSLPRYIWLNRARLKIGNEVNVGVQINPAHDFQKPLFSESYPTRQQKFSDASAKLLILF